MANYENPEKLPGDELPPFPPADLPTDPAELEAWKDKYVRDLVDHHPGGIDAPWRDGGMKGA